jgi:hypothetical protein
MVYVKIGDVPMAWEIAHQTGEAVYEMTKNGAARVFWVHEDIPEFALPFEAFPKEWIQWRDRHMDISYNEEEGTVDIAKLSASIQAEGVEPTRSIHISKTLVTMNNPKSFGEMLDREWLSGLNEPMGGSWPLVVGGVAIGFLEGWQLADMLLPDIGSSPWFALLLPLILVLGLIALAVKGD